MYKYSFDIIDKKTTGQRILQQMGVHGLTNGELAKLVGVSHNTVSNWCCGKCVIQLVHVVRLTRVFGISFNDLVAVQNLKDF